MKKSAKQNGRSNPAKRDPNRYPKGLNRQKVQAIIDHYENQTEDQASAEDEAAYHSNSVTMMGVPIKLVPKVQKMIARHR